MKIKSELTDITNFFFICKDLQSQNQRKEAAFLGRQKFKNNKKMKI